MSEIQGEICRSDLKQCNLVSLVGVILAPFGSVSRSVGRHSASALRLQKGPPVLVSDGKWSQGGVRKSLLHLLDLLLAPDARQQEHTAGGHSGREERRELNDSAREDVGAHLGEGLGSE